MHRTISTGRWCRSTVRWYFVYRAADRRPGEFRYRPVPTELAPGWLKRPLGIAIELLAPFQVSFTACGACLSLRRCSRLLPGAGRQYHVEYSDCWRAFSGPAFGIGILAAGVILAIILFRTLRR